MRHPGNEANLEWSEIVFESSTMMNAVSDATANAINGHHVPSLENPPVCRALWIAWIAMNRAQRDLVTVILEIALTNTLLRNSFLVPVPRP
jgi:hypothetical protein